MNPAATTHTTEPESRQDGPAPDAGREPGADPAPQKTKHIVQGDPDAGRALTLDFDRLIEALLDCPDPDPEDDKGYGPGVDLLLALRDEHTNFGRAAPDVAQNATIADAVLGITDEALDAAERFIIATSDEQPVRGENTAQDLCALMLEIGTFSIAREKDAIENLPPAVDPAIANDVDGTPRGGAFF